MTASPSAHSTVGGHPAEGFRMSLPPWRSVVLAALRYYGTWFAVSAGVAFGGTAAVIAIAMSRWGFCG